MIHNLCNLDIQGGDAILLTQQCRINRERYSHHGQD